jgi:hypothetical protein
MTDNLQTTRRGITKVAPVRSASVQNILDQQQKDAELKTVGRTSAPAAPAAPPTVSIPARVAEPAAIVPGTDSNDSLDAYLKAEGVVPSFGEEFNCEAQRGFYRWRDGVELTAEELDAIYMAITTMVYEGVIMFAGPGERPVQFLELVGGGKPIPTPEDYGGTEGDKKCEWPIGMSGLPENPYRRRTLLPCVRQPDGTAVTFVAQNWTSSSAIKSLLGHQRYTLDMMNPGSWPLIKFGIRQGKNAKGQTVPKCRITPCGKLPRNEAEARLLASSESEDPSDSIPF